ncbi:MAG: hypothetical protein K1060chlam1_00490 [Candidatus Anoxychlamydiales bacterium]|nr:hypothetical protein [Candidatus Anoxychlamydiales bacterium]
MQEINAKFFEDFHKTDVVCIYGKSDCEHLSFLKKWLKKTENRRIIFLEDDIKKYDDLLSFVDKHFEKERKKTQTIYIGNFEKDLKKIAWDSVYLDLKIIKGLKEKRKDSFDKIFQTLTDLHLGANLTSYLYSDFGINTFENFYYNILKNDEFILFENLKDQFKNIPAIIAGAGPSLDKNLDHLKGLEDKALIFAGGSVLNIFAKKNIKYHFAASIDQNPYFKRFKENDVFEKPFFYQNQINHNNLSLVHGRKILVSDYGAYPLKSWIYEMLNIKQETFEAGWTVTTFLIKIAKMLGCNPIITIGLDLSFKKHKYSRGVVKEKSEYLAIKTKDINGKEVLTQKDWILAKSWIEEYASKNKDKTFINATEGGLKLENFQSLKLLDVLNSLKSSLDLDLDPDLEGYIHTKISNENFIKLDNKKIIDVLSQILKSLKKSDEFLDEYLSDLEKKLVDFNLLKLQNQIAYTHLLEPLWQIWKHTLLRNIENNEIHILLNKLLFFKNVIFEHLNLLRKFL